MVEAQYLEAPMFLKSSNKNRCPIRCCQSISSQVGVVINKGNMCLAI